MAGQLDEIDRSLTPTIRYVWTICLRRLSRWGRCRSWRRTRRSIQRRVVMRYRLLGMSGLRVSQLFLGAMTFGDESGPGASLEECRRMLDAYAEAGGNVIDTAINYRNGASESIVGELLEG